MGGSDTILDRLDASRQGGVRVSGASTLRLAAAFGRLLAEACSAGVAFAIGTVDVLAVAVLVAAVSAAAAVSAGVLTSLLLSLSGFCESAQTQYGCDCCDHIIDRLLEIDGDECLPSLSS